MASGNRPVDQGKALNTSKLATIVAHQGGTKGKAVASDPEIVGPNRRAQALEDCGLLSVMAADGLPFGVEHGHLPGERIELRKGCLAALAALCALEQLRPGDERHRQGILVLEGINPFGHLGRTVFDQVDQDVGIEQVDHSDSRS